MQYSIDIPIELLQAIILELNKCSQQLHNRNLGLAADTITVTDILRFWVLNASASVPEPEAKAGGDEDAIRLVAKDVVASIQSCLNAIHELRAHHRKIVQLKRDVLEVLEQERVEKKAEVLMRRSSKGESSGS
ncbi:uncharacterized protein Z518_01854 [Rhinocladiella mackenziei CBS 650.93]|uniref:Uncharacterized protein n=1 Tax=Rhinocladiella mackenziei CBS 650.93 TaxID=1442369 RepID=A0A0D2IVH2_9EURO|nr:uncharacterized protein Z518_01854 [Rhinocladiella mackenziei CBS 650.93]KIX07201.1 hypothetical protein Z518_01854 [Rhinocladiella mackenziei CBS 650.93]